MEEVQTIIGIIQKFRNADKTQFIWLGTRQQLRKVDSNQIQLGSDVVKLQTTVNNLGVTIDNHLSMKEHAATSDPNCPYTIDTSNMRVSRPRFRIEQTRLLQ